MMLAVVGSRDIDPKHYWLVRFEVQNVAYRVGWDNLTIVSGGARGVDSMAQRAATEFGVAFQCFPADWKRYGKQAGMLRNQQIVDAADEILAFFGSDRTPGTSDTIRRATVKGIPTTVFQDGDSITELIEQRDKEGSEQ